MIQRIQTVYLALAVILLVLCCCMPLADFEPAGMGLSSTMYSLVFLSADGAIESYLPSVLFVIVVFTELTTITAIMGYNNRRRQMKTCSVAMILNLLWIIGYAVITYFLKGEDTLHPCFASCLPVLALILTWLARKAIKKDDDLVRSADRIR